MTQGARKHTTETIRGTPILGKLQPLLQLTTPSRGTYGYRLIYRGSCPLT